MGSSPTSLCPRGTGAAPSCPEPPAAAAGGEEQSDLVGRGRSCNTERVGKEGKAPLGGISLSVLGMTSRTPQLLLFLLSEPEHP